jgi:hypothetical protein
MALDGTSSVQDPEGGFILMDSGDEPQQIDSAGTYAASTLTIPSMITFSIKSKITIRLGKP